MGDSHTVGGGFKIGFHGKTVRENMDDRASVFIFYRQRLNRGFTLGVPKNGQGERVIHQPGDGFRQKLV